LKRSTKGTFLHIQGRDFDETIEKAVYFDRESCRWQILGDAAVVVLSKSERLILEALEAAVPNGLGAEEIMKRSGLKPRSTVDSTLSRMVEKGSIERQKRGVYVIATDATP
jgi:DNA-binding MarR family transcriptional regulator